MHIDKLYKAKNPNNKPWLLVSGPNQIYRNYAILKNVTFTVDPKEVPERKRHKNLHIWASGELIKHVPRVKFYPLIYDIDAVKFKLNGVHVDNLDYILVTQKGAYGAIDTEA